VYESLTISIPLFNEEESISNLYNEIIDVLSSIQKDRIAKLLLVNDGSTDNTAKLLDKYFSEVQDCQIIHHNENKNLDGFLNTAIKSCDTELIVFLDSDCTFNPSYIVEMLDYLDADTDIINGSPYHPKGKVEGINKARLILSYFSNYIYRKITNKNIYNFTSIFKMYRLNKIAHIKLENKGFVSVSELFIKSLNEKAVSKEFPCILTIRNLGESKIRIFQSIINHIKFMYFLIKN
jgi:dolichol-phosphate mannosyltransferase